MEVAWLERGRTVPVPEEGMFIQRYANFIYVLTIGSSKPTTALASASTTVTVGP